MFAGRAEVIYKPDRRVEIRLRPGAPDAGKLRSSDSALLELLAAKLPPYEEYKPSVWDDVVTEDNVEIFIYKEFS